MRWVEHYSELHSMERYISDIALDSLEDFLLMEELDSISTMEELRANTDAFMWKSIWTEWIPSKAIE